MTVINPVVTQTTINNPGLPTCRAMSADTMKMPDPIIEPATIMVASSGPRLLTNPWPAVGDETFARSLPSDICNHLSAPFDGCYRGLGFCPSCAARPMYFAEIPSVGISDSILRISATSFVNLCQNPWNRGQPMKRRELFKTFAVGASTFFANPAASSSAQEHSQTGKSKFP